MRTLSRMLLVASGATVLGFGPTLAWAQAPLDTNPPPPNVLLLIDTSGSMDYMISNPADPTGATPLEPSTCDGLTHANPDYNRWATLVEVLTGTIPPSAFSCESLDRGSQNFVNEYAYQGATPYDYKYFLPFHRIYINGCTVAPGTVDANWDFWQWPGTGNTYTPFSYHAYPYPTGGPCAQTGQAADGLLDVFAGQLRFGMMMFDTLPDPGTGNVANTTQTNGATGESGHWSYWYKNASNSWFTGLGYATGYPTGCSTPAAYDVGARNPAAPPWEGRLIPFSNPYPPNPQQDAINNANIQSEILAMRPYGATPIAGMMDDANRFLFSDVTPVDGTTQQLGPSNDPYWINGCRPTYVLLLTDGAPNEDLSGVCTPGGGCPYPTPSQTAYNMANLHSPNQNVLTYVVGFALSDPTALGSLPSPPTTSTGALNCDAITAANYQADCASPSVTLTPNVQACCALAQMAIQGGTNHAYFADDPTTLKQQLSTILTQIGAGSTARTWPVYFPAGPATAQGTQFQSAPAVAYQFNASFSVHTGLASVTGAPNPQAGMWSGNLTRTRYVCGNSATTTSTTTTTNGAAAAVAPTTVTDDVFSANVNMVADYPSNPRQFLTSIPGATAGGVGDPQGTIRPNIGATVDGFGTVVPYSGSPTTLTNMTGFPSIMSTYPTAFGVTAAQASLAPRHRQARA